MTTRSDLVTEVQERLLVANNSTVHTTERIITVVKNSYLWASQFVPWNDLVSADYTTSHAGWEYYQYPDQYLSESIVRMEVDGEKYSRRNFEDYLDYKNKNPNSQKKIFASFGRRYFIFPIIQTSDKRIELWGSVQADELTSDDSTTIFSNSKEEGNEAIIKKALSILIGRLDKNLARAEEEEAKEILLRLFADEQSKTQRNKRLDHPQFVVPDYFGNSLNESYNIGRFGYLPDDDWGDD